ncbi:HAD family hydrolase [Vibrio intestinalis]|uniref:HAD family hydrolase n=1 Tax=Vibrio intestinalis TaxID=2933291 RepID=UPI0021A3BB28|nr:HAD hydrolase-like protein [Vibrio intestinalis]
MKLNKSYSFAVFDCDGVILDSNKAKSEAFASALLGEDEKLINEFIDYHKSNGGISRYIKFEHFFKNIKNQKSYKSELEESLVRYAELSKQALLECEVIPGITRVLSELNHLDIPCYVVSGGDENELREVFNLRGLSAYFSGVFGSPLSKVDNLDILEKSGKLIGSGIFFGDARSDMEAAERYNLDFMFISGASEWHSALDYIEKKGLDFITNFTELDVNA